MEQFFSTVNSDDLTDNDTAVTYFFSGYICRSVSRQRRCSACKKIFVKDDDPHRISDCVPEGHKRLFSIADPSGLSATTAFCFAVSAVSVQYHTTTASDTAIKQTLCFKQPTSRLHASYQQCFTFARQLYYSYESKS